VDSLEDPMTMEFDSWLVHPDCLPNHLGLAQWHINTVANSGIPVYSPQIEHQLYISECNLERIDWAILITRHPEMVNPGYSCYTSYTSYTLGPRDPYVTLREFLITHCI
jgi:hypothetical protein